MAQFGIHALIGLWIAWSLPQFSPYVLRVSFGAGIYFGCVFPDMDMYAAAIAELVKPGSAQYFHRTLTHSVITAFALLVLFTIVEFIVRAGRRRGERSLYNQESQELDDDALLALSGALSSQERHPGIDFKVFGLGLFAGIMIHIMLDVLFWFSPIDLIYPLPDLGIGSVVDAWKYDTPYLATVILTLSELASMAVFFTVLRMSVKGKLGKWAEVPEEMEPRKRVRTDNDIEHGASYASLDFSLHQHEEICPIDLQTLTRARPALFANKIIILFQFLYFIGACFTPLIHKQVLTFVVFSELLFICIPAYFYLSLMYRDVILRKSM